MFDEFNAHVLLLPELHMAVNGSRNDEIRPMGHNDEIDDIPVHEGLRVPVRTGKMLEIELLVG